MWFSTNVVLIQTLIIMSVYSNWNLNEKGCWSRGHQPLTERYVSKIYICEITRLMIWIENILLLFHCQISVNSTWTWRPVRRVICKKKKRTTLARRVYCGMNHSILLFLHHFPDCLSIIRRGYGCFYYWKFWDENLSYILFLRYIKCVCMYLSSDYHWL
jgi:hypothetical protein